MAGTELGHDFVESMLVRNFVAHGPERELQAIAVEIAQAVERIGFRREPPSGSGVVHQTQRAPLRHLCNDARGNTPTDRFDVESRIDHTAKFVGGDAPVQTVDGIDAQLFFDQFSDVGHGGAGRIPQGRAAHLVAVRAGDCVAMVAVGDEDGSRRHE